MTCPSFASQEWSAIVGPIEKFSLFNPFVKNSFSSFFSSRVPSDFFTPYHHQRLWLISLSVPSSVWVRLSSFFWDFFMFSTHTHARALWKNSFQTRTDCRSFEFDRLLTPKNENFVIALLSCSFSYFSDWSLQDNKCSNQSWWHCLLC